MLRFLVPALALSLAADPAAQAIVLQDEVEDGGVVDDGRNDIFDDFGQFYVNGVFYKGAATQDSPEVFSIAPQNIGSLQVTGQVVGFDQLGLLDGRPDFRIVRWWIRIRNQGSAPATVAASLDGNLGSDGNTVQRASSNGQGFSARTSWAVTADNPNDTNSDPAFGFVQNSARAAIRPVSSARVGVDSVYSKFDFRLLPGQSVSLVWFGVARNVAGSGSGGVSTAADAVSDITQVLLDSSGNVRSQFLASGLQGPAYAINHSVAAGATDLRVRVRSATRSKSGVVTARGTASGRFGISVVNFKVADLTGRAKGTKGWTLRTRAPGAITVRATDSLGNESRPARVRVRG